MHTVYINWSPFVAAIFFIYLRPRVVNLLVAANQCSTQLAQGSVTVLTTLDLRYWHLHSSPDWSDGYFPWPVWTNQWEAAGYRYKNWGFHLILIKNVGRAACSWWSSVSLQKIRTIPEVYAFADHIPTTCSIPTTSWPHNCANHILYQPHTNHILTSSLLPYKGMISYLRCS